MTGVMSRVVTTLLVFASPAVLPAEDRTEWMIAPYGWLPDIRLTDAGDGGDTGGVDLLDKTDAAGMVRIEVARSRWGVLCDYIFLDLSDSGVIQSPGGLLPDIDVRAELDLAVIEFGAVYRPAGTGGGIHYLFGYRGINAEQTLLLTPDGSGTQRISADSRLSDVFLGMRYVSRISESWQFTLRGDYSAGESDGVLNLLASVGYRFAGPAALQAGYRHVDLEYQERQDGQRVETEIGLSGAFLGLVLRF